ncbi:MAG: hypothetical protein QM642_03500 [Edaphocola sp.]
MPNLKKPKMVFRYNKQRQTHRLGQKKEPDLSYSYNYDFYATLMYQKSYNTDDEPDQDNLTAYYNLTLNAKVVVKKFLWTSYFGIGNER